MVLWAGRVTRTDRIEVGPAGDIFLAELGAMNVAGQTLADARAAILAKLQKVTRDVRVDVQLSCPRRFRVYVSGAVNDPGPAEVLGGSRVSDILRLDLLKSGASTRNIEVKRRDGTLERADLERVIRKGAFPVLMVNNEAQRKYENVVAPVDLSDASAHAIRTALSIGLISGERATLLHAFVALAKGKMFIAGYDQNRIDSYVASEHRQANEELTAFMIANRLGTRWQLRLEEGTPMEIITRAVSDMLPDLLVMGTHSRSAMLMALIGSVTEAALRSLSVDILAVPPPK